MKLVRDKIPEIILKQGRTCSYRYADEKEFKKLLVDKLQEETKEYVENNNPEELADIIEVIKALAEQHNIRIDQLELTRKKKAEERGAFTKRIVLEKWEN